MAAVGDEVKCTERGCMRYALGCRCDFDFVQVFAPVARCWSPGIEHAGGGRAQALLDLGRGRQLAQPRRGTAPAWLIVRSMSCDETVTAR